MKSQGISSEDSACCLAGDFVTAAADVMWRQRTGRVPVVEDRRSRWLVGMITDRHLAIRIIAAGLDPRRTLVRDIMEQTHVADEGDPA